jgi:hypothetical protein
MRHLQDVHALARDSLPEQSDYVAVQKSGGMQEVSAVLLNKE